MYFINKNARIDLKDTNLINYMILNPTNEDNLDDDKYKKLVEESYNENTSPVFSNVQNRTLNEIVNNPILYSGLDINKFKFIHLKLKAKSNKLYGSPTIPIFIELPPINFKYDITDFFKKPYFELPIDMNKLSNSIFYEKIISIDNFISSNEFKKSYFGDLSDYYKLQPLINLSENLVPYININFEVDNNKQIITKINDKERDKKDINNYKIYPNSTITFVIRCTDLWATTPSKTNNKNNKYGLTFVACKCDIN